MGQPKIKIHQLPRGYTPGSDRDVQAATGDELLPVVDKDILLRTSIPKLTGVAHSQATPCTPIDVATGRQTFDLDADGEPIGTTMSDLVIGPVGAFEMRVLDVDDNVVPASQYSIVSGAIVFSATAPIGPKISAFVKSSVPTTSFALKHDQVYKGQNESFNKVMVTANGGPVQVITPVDPDAGLVILTSPASTATADFWYRTPISDTFIGEQGNWVQGHMNMEPDVFVGLQDYPGNNYTGTPGNGATNTQPQYLPAYVDRAKIQVDYRRGAVRFLRGPVDTTANGYGYAPLTPYSPVPAECSDGTASVRCNYAYLDGIKNVTGQRLDPVDGTNKVFKASTESVWPESHDKRWVTKVTPLMPRNIYVNNVLTPTVQVVTNEVMTIKTSN